MTALRLIMLAASAASVSACNPLMQGSLDTLGASLHRPAGLEVTQAQVDSLPYYQIQVTTEFGSAVMALVRVQGKLQYWRANSNQLLLLEDGVIVRTLGFPNDLLGTRLAAGSPFPRELQRVADGQPSHRWIDLASSMQFDIPLSGAFHPAGIETVRILERDYTLLRIDEVLKSPIAGMSSTNHYWVDPQDGFVMQSRQQVTPILSVTLTQLRPLRGQP
ncbi:YjbF family lipoprotein [Pseudomonas sp. PDM23]|uniref:YjbF family lipoprotein n=1 Tax=unclassified Pseudomonas TaxID=196821 RepID=UPI0017826976|nr:MULTISPECIES: YjbF family lipoprotein [unclassified Pseudomonas]MBD9503592.1 YjbF family lipoprotein [Pseudomonas sp. PDM17]MBD9574075.1 YjbF family lipoprotein [Pseudomonas sp. PDM23]MBD9671913.1 YjbF family lipoprotein [Pseudomonas sp. PDM21]